MNFSNMIETNSFFYAMLSGVVVGSCAYCIWNGRKVIRQWINDSDDHNDSVVRIYRATEIAWKDDDNNPANWYLKDPNKFKDR
jgi:hypothetical protein